MDLPEIKVDFNAVVMLGEDNLKVINFSQTFNKKGGKSWLCYVPPIGGKILVTIDNSDFGKILLKVDNFIVFEGTTRRDSFINLRCTVPRHDRKNTIMSLSPQDLEEIKKSGWEYHWNGMEEKERKP